MGDLVRRAEEIAEAFGGDREMVGKISMAMRWAYDSALHAAREQCAVEDQDCESDAEKRRCRNIATACLHMMYDAETES
mgnify:CR=1 FL=1